MGLAIIGIQVADLGRRNPLSERHLEPKERPQETKSNKKRERTEEHEKHMQQKQSVV